MTGLKFGLALPYTNARTVAKLASLAEDAGWDGCFLGDSIWCEDPMISLAAAALTTRHIRLGTMIIPMPLRRPWKVASESVQLIPIYRRCPGLPAARGHLHPAHRPGAQRPLCSPGQ